MKRYTLKFMLLDTKITCDQIRGAVEEVLLRLHPRITYKFMRVVVGEDGEVLAEIAMEGHKELLESAIKSKDWKLPVRLASIGWGWVANIVEERSSTPGTPVYNLDPLSSVNPLDGQGKFRLNKRRLWLRYIVLVITTLIMTLLIIANFIHKYSPVLEGIYILVFLVWMFSLNETPNDFRVYAENVICDQEELVVKYWFRKRPIQLRWEEIWGMNYSQPVCVVFRMDGKIRFLLSERFGCKEQTLVLKTIAKRSDLNYVGGNFNKMVYRRYNAPDRGD